MEVKNERSNYCTNNITRKSKDWKKETVVHIWTSNIEVLQKGDVFFFSQNLMDKYANSNSMKFQIL